MTQNITVISAKTYRTDNTRTHRFGKNIEQSSAPAPTQTAAGRQAADARHRPTPGRRRPMPSRHCQTPGQDAAARHQAVVAAAAGRPHDDTPSPAARPQVVAARRLIQQARQGNLDTLSKILRQFHGFRIANPQITILSLEISRY
jgi:hypothetical protein